VLAEAMPQSVKSVHEIRDPLHVFIRLDSDERRFLDARPLQRLRHIHQLALSSLVYPGATHKRFEHSLGVMELAGRVYDQVTSAKVSENIASQLPELDSEDSRRYWRRVIRLAALSHDVGHLPFSHAAERELLPDGWDHERLTREILLSDEARQLLAAMTPPVRAEDVVKLAVGPKKAKDLTFSTWEALLADIIVGDAFGVDRVDYLLRDSYHAGVAYGRFDHFRLLDTLRILPLRSHSDEDSPPEPALGIEEGGIQSAEALLIARYMMYSQVYFHPVRRAYDVHLKDFLAAWLPGGRFPTSVNEHLSRSDNDVMAAITAAAFDAASEGHDQARRIACRQHFRVLYQRNPADELRTPKAVTAVFRAARQEFGSDHVKVDQQPAKGAPAFAFPVLQRDGRVVSSLAVSDALNHLPAATFGYVFISPEQREAAQTWLDARRDRILGAVEEEVGEEGHE
jgi:uncharacterized protein